MGDVAATSTRALALNDLANADGYTLKHSLAVTTLGLSLGLRVMQQYGWVDAHGKRRFDGIEDRLALLGVGLLLHDIGKLAVPPEILQKARTADRRRVDRRCGRTRRSGVQILQQGRGHQPAGARRRPLASRALERHRLPRRPGGRRDPPVRADRGGGGRVRRADLGSLSTGAPCRCTRATTSSSSARGIDFDPEVVDFFGRSSRRTRPERASCSRTALRPREGSPAGGREVAGRPHHRGRLRRAGASLAKSTCHGRRSSRSSRPSSRSRHPPRCKRRLLRGAGAVAFRRRAAIRGSGRTRRTSLSRRASALAPGRCWSRRIHSGSHSPPCPRIPSTAGTAPARGSPWVPFPPR